MFILSLSIIFLIMIEFLVLEFKVKQLNQKLTGGQKSDTKAAANKSDSVNSK